MGSHSEPVLMLVLDKVQLPFMAGPLGRRNAAAGSSDLIFRMVTYGSSLSARAPSDKAPFIVEAAPIPAAFIAVIGLWLGATGDETSAAYGLFQALGGFVIICLVAFVAGA